MDLSACTSTSTMFGQCNALKVSPIFTNTRTLTTINSMFQSCKRLVNIPWFDTVNVTAANSLFNGCSSLTSVPQLN